MDVLSLNAVADRVMAESPRAGATRVIAVDGPSGSGKTTLARRLSRALSCRTIHMDDIYPGWDGLAEAPELLVDQVLRPLAAGRVAGYRQWDWQQHQWAQFHTVDPDPVLLVEGVGSGALPCAPFLSLLVWIEAPRDERMRRGIERDGETFRPHWERWAGQEQTMFASHRTRQRADLHVNGQPDVPHRPDDDIVLLHSP